jgi:multidrug efflux pump subunit AcrB
MDKIFAYFIKDRLLVNLILIIIAVVGLLSVRNINREIFPATELDTMRISISYPGASARDVELNALKPVEDALADINGVKEFTSLAQDGFATISVDIDDEIRNTRMVKDEIHRTITLSTVSGVSNDVEAIRITEFNAKLIPVLRVALIPLNDSTESEELYDMADVLENLFKKTEGVSSVTLSGYYNKRVHVKVNPNQMEEAFVSISEVVSSISNRNIKSSGGSIETDDEEQNILTVGEFKDPLEVGEVIIRSGFETGIVRVKDIADIIYGFETSDIKIRANGQETVILTIRKKETADSIDTVDSLYETIEKNKNIYGDNFEVVTLFDTSSSIRSQIRIVITNALIGFALVIVTLIIFLDFRTSFWTAFSIPLCLLMVMIYLNYSGNTINIITLGAIITVLGMLVDDAIVVAETIFVKKEQGVPPHQAALEGLKEVIAPVTVTIISTIVAFLPMMMIQGRMGRFIYLFPVVIGITLLSSLAEATFILPNHLAHQQSKRHKEKEWFNAIKFAYRKILKKVLQWRYGVLTGFIILLIISLMWSFAGMRRFRLSRHNISEEIVLELEASTQTTLNEMEKLTIEVEKTVMDLVKDDEFKSMMTYVGQHSDSRNEGNHSNWATIDINLVPNEQRSRTTKQIIQEMRKTINTEQMNQFTDIVFKEQRRGPSVGNAIDIKVISNNEEDTNKVISEIEEYMSGVAGIKDITNDLKSGNNEIHIVFNYDKLSAFGLSVSDVASTVRIAYNGTEAASIQKLDEKLEFEVSLDERYRNDPERLLNLLIPNKSGNLIRLGDVATLNFEPAQTSIKHYNGERTITINADVDEKKITPIEANRRVMEQFANITNMYPAVTLQFKGEFEETNTALYGLATAFIAALIMIYLIVLFLFRSVGQPFIVLSVVPFGLIGVLLAFKLHGMQLEFMAIIGVIGLSGVVINDSIIMVEFINKMRKKIKNTFDRTEFFNSILDGASQRLRPILLTTITTVVGLLPSVYGIGGDAGTLVPTVMAMAYGLLFATLLTLFFVPSLYLIGIDIQNVFRFGSKEVK